MRRFAKARPRHNSGEMNSLEAAYAVLLEQLRIAGEVKSFVFERVTLKIAEPQVALATRYTPDFMVISKDDTIEFHECKGFLEEDAAVKIKCASEQYPFRFVMVRKRAKKDGGGFSYTEY